MRVLVVDQHPVARTVADNHVDEADLGLRRGAHQGIVGVDGVVGLRRVLLEEVAQRPGRILKDLLFVAVAGDLQTRIQFRGRRVAQFVVA